MKTALSLFLSLLALTSDAVKVTSPRATPTTVLVSTNSPPPPMPVAVSPVAQSPKASALAQTTGKQMATTQAVVLPPPAGNPLPTTNVWVVWQDGRLTNATVASYNVYCGPDGSDIYHEWVTNLAQWQDTNSVGSTNKQWVLFNLTNVVCENVYSLDVIALSSNGSPAYLTNGLPASNYVSTEIRFMAEKWLRPSFAGTNCFLTFQAVSNHTYTVQSATNLPTTNWTSINWFTNAQGVVTFKDNSPAVAKKFYRLLIQ